MGHNSVVSGHPKPTRILRVDGLSTDPLDLGCHTTLFGGVESLMEGEVLIGKSGTGYVFLSQVGGLGFRELHEFNLALLSRQGWKLMTDPSSLIAQLYHAKYYPNSNFLNLSLGTNPNYTWRSIWATRDLLRKHSRWRVGDGSQIFIKQDPWLAHTESSVISNSLGVNFDNVRFSL